MVDSVVAVTVDVGSVMTAVEAPAEATDSDVVDWAGVVARTSDAGGSISV